MNNAINAMKKGDYLTIERVKDDYLVCNCYMILRVSKYIYEREFNQKSGIFRLLEDGERSTYRFERKEHETGGVDLNKLMTGKSQYSDEIARPTPYLKEVHVNKGRKQANVLLRIFKTKECDCYVNDLYYKAVTDFNFGGTWYGNDRRSPITLEGNGIIWAMILPVNEKETHLNI